MTGPLGRWPVFRVPIIDGFFQPAARFPSRLRAGESSLGRLPPSSGLTGIGGDAHKAVEIMNAPRPHFLDRIMRVTIDRTGGSRTEKREENDARRNQQNGDAEEQIITTVARVVVGGAKKKITQVVLVP